MKRGRLRFFVGPGKVQSGGAPPFNTNNRGFAGGVAVGNPQTSTSTVPLPDHSHTASQKIETHRFGSRSVYRNCLNTTKYTHTTDYSIPKVELPKVSMVWIPTSTVVEYRISEMVTPGSRFIHSDTKLIVHTNVGLERNPTKNVFDLSFSRSATVLPPIPGRSYPLNVVPSARPSWEVFALSKTFGTNALLEVYLKKRTFSPDDLLESRFYIVHQGGTEEFTSYLHTDVGTIQTPQYGLQLDETIDPHNPGVQELSKLTGLPPERNLKKERAQSTWYDSPEWDNVNVYMGNGFIYTNLFVDNRIPKSKYRGGGRMSFHEVFPNMGVPEVGVTMRYDWNSRRFFPRDVYVVEEGRYRWLFRHDVSNYRPFLYHPYFSVLYEDDGYLSFASMSGSGGDPFSQENYNMYTQTDSVFDASDDFAVMNHKFYHFVLPEQTRGHLQRILDDTRDWYETAVETNLQGYRLFVDVEVAHFTQPIPIKFCRGQNASI